MENSNLIPVNEQEVLSKIFDLVADNDELKEKLSFNQEMIYTLETELSGLKKLRVLDFMASDEHLCKTCREIKSTKERQLWLLNKMFNKVLFKKPKDLLHMSKIFHHFEILVEKGSLLAKFDDLEGDKCKTCNQVLNPDTFSSKFDSCIQDEINNLRGIASFAKCFEHMKLVMGVNEEVKKDDQVDTIGVEPLMTRRKMSFSGSPKENEANNESARLQDEVVELKSQEAGGKTRSSSVIYGQQQAAEKKDAKFVYNLGVHIKLSAYSAAPHEDPNILLRKWEHELRKCGIPRADWVLFVTKNFKETAHQWWELQGCCEELAWDEFKVRFQRAFGRVELRRWLTYAGNLCFSQANEPIGTYVMRRFQIVLRAVNQNQPLALKLLEKHINMRVGRYLNFHSYEDFFFALVADQVMDFDAIKLMFSQVLMEIRNDDRYWHDLL